MLPSHCGLKLRPRPSLGRSRICRGCCEDLQLKRQRRACTFQHWREMSHTFPHVLLRKAMWGQIGPTYFMRDVRTIRPDLRNPIRLCSDLGAARSPLAPSILQSGPCHAPVWADCHGSPAAQRPLGCAALVSPGSEEGISSNLPSGAHPSRRARRAVRHDLRVLARPSRHAFAPTGLPLLQNLFHFDLRRVRGDRR